MTPLAPFGHACVRAGHEVLVAAQLQHRANVARTGLPFAAVADPPAEEWMPLLGTFGALGVDEANALMIGEFFARIDTRAALPGLRAIAESFAPDIIVRESWEFASTLVAELHGIPLARVGLGLAEVEELSVTLAAPAIDDVRAGLGLAPDPAGERLREGLYLTMVPEPLEDPAAVAHATTRRFASLPPGALAPDPDPLPADWWPGRDEPLVYLTFGSVTAGAHLPYFPALYRAAAEALADVPARVLLTTGNERDAAELGPLPVNVHVEPWVAQDAVAPHAAAIVGHGGYGTTVGALSHGVPLVVLPLFSTDQWANAAAVARAGAGIALDGERPARAVLGLPSEATLDGLAPAVERVLGDGSYRAAAARIAASVAELPQVDAAVEMLAGAAQAAPAEAALTRPR